MLFVDIKNNVPKASGYLQKSTENHHQTSKFLTFNI